MTYRGACGVDMHNSSRVCVQSQRPNAPTKYWRAAYGAIYICAAISLLVALGLNAHSIAAEAVDVFGFEWAFWSSKKLEMGLFAFVAFWVLLALFERRFPAGAIKPASGWFLNFKVNLLAWVLTPFIGALFGALLGYLSSRTALVD
jgi:hypothetical protein